VKIQVDGGINEETGPLALGAGADLLVSGSTMVKSRRPQETYRKILGIPDLAACPPTTT
jgi:pentose-5-phosphate-3-epimerase